MKKRWIALFFAIVLSFIFAADTSSAERYDDVKPGDRFYDSINFIADRGLIDASGGNFNPGVNVDKATVVTAFYRLAGSPSVTYMPVFTDVPAGQRHSASAVWANEIGMLVENGDGRFGPNDVVTRQQLAAMMFRFADIKSPQTADLGGFTDRGDLNAWAEKGMGWSVARGLITGATGATLDPTGGVTRAQFADTLQRFVNIREDPGNIWVLNPRPTKPPVETPGLAPRVKGGWAGKTIVAISNYNAHLGNVFGSEIEKQIKATLSEGETVRLIYIGDLTVIRFQTINPSRAPEGNWEYMGYDAFVAEVEAGKIKPDAMIVGGGF